MKKRAVSLLLAVIMITGMLLTSSYAAKRQRTSPCILAPKQSAMEPKLLLDLTQARHQITQR
ncbi:hypothetical protein CDQ84_09230 [Clostridium thermosuccinogenes]|uniref:Uncharacterized protein n=1 Tax=Clostridium thermosuccinogenes TaxID=84032 RepID=A0A2K2FEV3_9CLOT|nr:hypothetical protein CDO33_02000 [Pseudoclostridium thermosuccinogenes]PNT90618.1 hypothetical protein CDQ83_18420 [Pseudoclostridium thermosuccinogenes]PNT97286.1 hypothetical protein CDQ85_09080 [Pseudoclostridium thermosuccinogenes]PNT99263.1 hypothetical protein CDQ84_09230 [Pseudoclostridium thermosuccinogenes]